MRIAVDAQRCQGHALCAVVAPDLFDLSEEDGHAVPWAAAVPAGREAEAEHAEAGCPERAVELES
ncbi:ferredoxin [Amycolatopsis acidiphila]|uniref:Ferredoxin n=1 Tax=Amycolatopsis acidiphila TaxID=715473 RepID=A0A558AB12_9PSEU|nr:ferredoxin [Amycolatopsis acidiphila]TVT21459.1 ferredoxin [Amycolatopsis acidiphila]UIJ63136.1 ferredoxin [Amycolatopsis acidiphila]GHG73946.1 ferredoxin [Amycolatopsis acidiphila]